MKNCIYPLNDYIIQRAADMLRTTVDNLHIDFDCVKIKADYFRHQVLDNQLFYIESFYGQSVPAESSQKKCSLGVWHYSDNELLTFASSNYFSENIAVGAFARTVKFLYGWGYVNVYCFTKIH